METVVSRISARRKCIERRIVDAVIKAVQLECRQFKAIYLSPEDMAALNDTWPRRERDDVDGIPVRVSKAVRPRSILYASSGEGFSI
jgi:hypothetical protein